MEYKGKRILVIFEDGKEHVSKKEGVCTSQDGNGVMLDKKHFIPLRRIIRVEVLQ